MEFVNPSSTKFLGGSAITNTLLAVTAAVVIWKVILKK